MTVKKKLRGFAAMTPAQRRAIASKGGKAVPPEKRTFAKNPALAAAAGRIGGQSAPAEKRSFSMDRDLAAEAGSKGGKNSGGNFRNDPDRAREMGRAGGLATAKKGDE